MMGVILRKAYIYIRDCFAGILSETDSGYSFVYDEEYLMTTDSSQVSLTLPLRKEPYDSRVLFSFFDGLISEGWLLDMVSRNWKIDKKDRFGILLVSCKDPIGNVTVFGEKR